MWFYNPHMANRVKMISSNCISATKLLNDFFLQYPCPVKVLCVSIFNTCLTDSVKKKGKSGQFCSDDQLEKDTEILVNQI